MVLGPRLVCFVVSRYIVEGGLLPASWLLSLARFESWRWPQSCLPLIRCLGRGIDDGNVVDVHGVCSSNTVVGFFLFVCTIVLSIRRCVVYSSFS